MNRSILVVEDDIVFCKMLTRYFQKHNYTTYDAQNVQDALKLIHAEQLDILLIDYKLPDGSGLDVLQAGKEKAQNIRCFMMSRVKDASLEEKASELGAENFIQKPFSPQDLLPIMQNH
ncbi:MAG: response regulator [Cyclobacteriaceae bacterium]|nr:response regulator [Cyclobacteriaceae bacterium]MCH8517422.1 response regulator [Cyclobacteriaceae bacterium]